MTPETASKLAVNATVADVAAWIDAHEFITDKLEVVVSAPDLREALKAMRPILTDEDAA